MTARQRKRPGRPLHGWLVLDKPAGITSAAAVARAKRISGAAKVGHGGTLDPLATGILPLAFGEATKTISFVMDRTKTYRFSLRFGEERHTDDAEGEVLETSPVRPTEAAVRAVIPEFVGDIEQMPPAVSALKVGGKRAYDLVREGKDPDLKARRVRIERLDFLGFTDANTAQFEARCGKGVYMRSLARDLARRLLTRGHITGLRRTAVGSFTLDRAISLAKLERLWHSAPASELLLPVMASLVDIPALAITEDEAKRLRSGCVVPVLPTDNPTDGPTGNHGVADRLAEGTVVVAVAAGKPVAVARIVGDRIRPVRVLHL
jgi:tRNA pseudouridine55 synthase